MASFANRYSATHRQWDHVGNLFPNVEHAEKGPHGRLAGDFIPAPWLPVQVEDKHFEVWTVVSPGKIVALTTQAEEILSPVGDWEDSSHVVPAGLKVDWAAAAAGATVLTYTADDYEQQTVDLVTGIPYAINGTTDYSKTDITTALRSRGLIGGSEDCDAFISYPVGVAAQVFYQWSALNGSKFNPADAKFHNFRMQHQVQILCSYQLRLPWVPGDVVTEAVPVSILSSTPVFGTSALHDVASTIAMTRFSGITSTTFVMWTLADFPLAGPTDLCPLTASSTTMLVRKKGSVNALSAAGDYFIDREVGAIFFYDVNGGSGVIPASIISDTLTYWSYQDASTASNYAMVASGATVVKNGGFLACDADSNFAVDTAPTAADPFRMGQVVGFKTYPKDMVHRVKTQYTNLGSVNKMPGTATRGLPESLTYSNGADKEVVINLFTR